MFVLRRPSESGVGYEGEVLARLGASLRVCEGTLGELCEPTELAESSCETCRFLDVGVVWAEFFRSRSCSGSRSKRGYNQSLLVQVL